MLAKGSREERCETVVSKGRTIRSAGSGWEFMTMSPDVFHPISRIHLTSHSPPNHSQQSGEWQCSGTDKQRRIFEPLPTCESSPDDVIVDSGLEANSDFKVNMPGQLCHPIQEPMPLLIGVDIENQGFKEKLPESLLATQTTMSCRFVSSLGCHSGACLLSMHRQPHGGAMPINGGMRFGSSSTHCHALPRRDPPAAKNQLNLASFPTLKPHLDFETVPSESNCFNCNIPKSRGVAPILHLHPPAAQDWPPLKSEQKPPPGRCRARGTPRHRTDRPIPASRRRNFRLPLLPHRRLAAPGWPQTPLSSRSFPHCRPASRMARRALHRVSHPPPAAPKTPAETPNLLGNSGSQPCGSLPPGGKHPPLHGDRQHNAHCQTKPDDSWPISIRT